MSASFCAFPGEELANRLSERDMSISESSRKIDVCPSRISEVISGKRKISIETAKKIAKFFRDTDPEYWLVKQLRFILNHDKYVNVPY